ncbi:MAG: Ltp family lipoprotein, partial [Enterococcus sp.]|nr:Ltp family lipoprotein [Enterococcus sp.]
METIESSQPAKESVSDVPSEYRSALRSAKSYSDRMHMSKASIYDPLTSEYGEKFTAT